MTEAEKYFEEFFEMIRPHINGHKTAMELFFKGMEQIKIDKESYHQSRISSISDEMSDIQKIRKNPYSEDDLVTAFNVGWEQCRKSAKQKLLNK